MDTFFSAFPDLISLGRQRAMLRLLTSLTAIILAITTVYFALDMYQLWQIWPLQFNTSRTTALTAGTDCLLAANNLVMLFLANSTFWNIVKSQLGTSKRPKPQLSLALAVLAAIRAHDASLPPVSDAAEHAIDEELHALEADSVKEGVEIADVAHPIGSAGALTSVWACVTMGIVAVSLVCAGIILAITGFQPLISDGPDPAIATLHMPLLTWISTYRFGLYFGFFELLAVVSGVYLGVWTLLSWRYNQIERMGFKARIDAEKIQALFLGARDMVWTARWGDVNGFARRRYRDVWLHDHEIYLLLVGESVLIWEKPPSIRYMGPKFTARQTAARVAADALVEQVKLRAPTALVDLSKMADAPQFGLAFGLRINGYYPEPETVRAALGAPRFARWYQRFGWIVTLLLIIMAVGTMAAVFVIVQPFR